MSQSTPQNRALEQIPTRVEKSVFGRGIRKIIRCVLETCVGMLTLANCSGYMPSTGQGFLEALEEIEALSDRADENLGYLQRY